jgi:enoyl-CoA hydratase/carnithine racemase
MSEFISIEHQDRVTTITINRPAKKNALTQSMYGAMADAITHYAGSDESRALVITGTGDMFTSGNDLSDFSTGGTSDEVPPVGRFLQAIKDCPKPVIAAVNGGAIGVGLTMLLHCDLVYAGESALLSAPFVALGLVPEAASSMLLPAAVGMAMANDIFLTGRRISAKEALDCGLVARVFADTELAAEVRKIALQVAGSAPAAMTRTKALVRHQRDKVTAQMAAESKVFADQLKSPDFAEVIAAKMQKRMPVFG